MVDINDFMIKDRQQVLCDKCHRYVASNNNVAYWEVLASALHKGNDPLISLKEYVHGLEILIGHPRHLLGTEHCEGSPSRQATILHGMESYQNGRKLPYHKWKPISPDLLQITKQAYALLIELEDPEDVR